jgi:hypothetical protein
MTTVQDANPIDALPPAQYLIVEVLVARHRLGHDFWTFPDQLRKKMRRLEAAGLVGYRSGPAPASIQAWLTNTGRSWAMLPGYVPPIMGGPK